ncbi:MAG: hypothetical protein EXS14_04585 [Planctomycetes bacterium]|nr:hypothetical protein [Planctomycetota bacterium]
MRSLHTCLTVLALCSLLCSQGTAALEKRVASTQETLANQKTQMSALYERLEKALVSDHETLLATLRTEMGTALAAARSLSGAPRAKLLAEVKKGLQSMERSTNATCADLAAWIAPRVLTVLQNNGEVAAGLARKDDELVTLILEPLLNGGRPFHVLWNDELSAVLPTPTAWRRAHADVEAAKEALLTAKDPSAAFRRGAPSGFARIPAGNYATPFTAGFAGQGVRKKDRAFVLDHDLFLGIHEVTNAEYLGWLLKLSEEERRVHQPRDETGKPIWEPEPGTGILAVPVGAEANPVCSITFQSAMAYAQAHGARLPTEEEWCAAAAGREKNMFPWGARHEPGRCNDRDRDHTNAGLMPVGSFPQGVNAFGHMDLAGNVAEWTMTYESGKLVDAAAVAQENVAVRGGSFRNGDRDVSTGWVWLKRAIGDRDSETGFRLLVDPAAKPR